ncbi:TBC1 domain family member 5-like isoform X1 [Styela clava]
MKMSEHTATLNSYLNQWAKYFEENGDELLTRLRNFAFEGELRSCKFRSICWRIFLNCLPSDIEKWKNTIEISRQHYVDIKNKHVTIPSHEAEEKDLDVENPLSQNDQSSWMKFFRNSDLKKTIERDVKRTYFLRFPEMEYFHNEAVHELLVNVLFCYAQEHSDLSYRQGMHELLAPLVFIIHCDLQAACHAREIGHINKDLIDVILNEEYLEHDSYDMFCKLMESTNAWYSITERVSKEKIKDDGISEEDKSTKSDTGNPIPKRPFQPQEIATSGGPTLAITNKLNHIHNTLLVQHDLQLHTHLNRLEIIPQVFGLRWIRLLFGREFSLQDLLVLWDAMFADSSTLDLVDYLFVAMLIHIRNHLLTADYSSCMQLLMRYPPVDDINDIVKAAKDIRQLKTRSFSDSLIEASADASVNKIQRGPKKNVTQPLTASQRQNSNKQNSLSRMFKDFTRKVIPENKPIVPTHSSLNDPTYAGDVRSPAQAKTRTSPQWNMNGNPPFFKNSSTITEAPRAEEMHRKHPAQLEEEVIYLHKELEKMKQMCLYCSDKIDASVTVLQSSVNLTTDEDDNNENGQQNSNDSMQKNSTASQQQKFEKEQILVTVASLKQIRDLLQGSLTFNPNLKEYKNKKKTNNINNSEPKIENGNDPEVQQAVPQSIVNTNADAGDA